MEEHAEETATGTWQHADEAWNRPFVHQGAYRECTEYSVLNTVVQQVLFVREMRQNSTFPIVPSTGEFKT
jgi:hypothetical protein